MDATSVLLRFESGYGSCRFTTLANESRHDLVQQVGACFRVKNENEVNVMLGVHIDDMN